MTFKPSVGSLLSEPLLLIKDLFEDRESRKVPPTDSFWRAVKLVHAADLPHWGAFKEYSQHDGITYAEYNQEAYRIQGFKRDVRKSLKIEEQIAELDQPALKQYDTISVDVPCSWRRCKLTFSLPAPLHDQTQMRSTSGEIRNGMLHIQGAWRKHQCMVHRVVRW
jgi:hypothetical protein